MLAKRNLLKQYFSIYLIIQMMVFGTMASAISKESTAPEIENITWDTLIPDDYDANEKINELKEQLNQFRDNDPEAMVIYGNMQAELDNSPVNTSLDGKTIKMPGFIAPLEVANGVVSEFLLVPYYGACMHLPPPPMNQTVFIKADKGQGIKFEDVDLPVWITGKLKTVEERTDIGAAGYRIEKAKVEIYKDKK